MLSYEFQDEFEEEAQPEPEEAALEPTPIPDAAGGVTKSDEKRPKTSLGALQAKAETEYDAQFIGQKSSPLVQCENRLLALA